MHSHRHAFEDYHPRTREGLCVASRRSMLKASMAGIAGLSLPGLLEARAAAGSEHHIGAKSVILLWMAGGPSHIDTWDPKPDRPWINRGPFGVTQTKLPGTIICEHLPKQAAMLDKFTIIRSVDCRKSNHEPNRVMQTGNREAGPRVNPRGHLYPAIASIVARHRGANHPAMPSYVAFMKSRSHLAFAGYLGKQYDPFIGDQVADLHRHLPPLLGPGADAASRPGRSVRGERFRGLTWHRAERVGDQVGRVSQNWKLRAPPKKRVRQEESLGRRSGWRSGSSSAATKPVRASQISGKKR